jgi:hypothetical protein
VKEIKIKKQTKAQRLANPVWLRQQIAELVADCDDSIKEDLAMAAQTSGDVSTSYSASVRIHRHWKKQLERILAGKTSADAHADTLAELGVSP